MCFRVTTLPVLVAFALVALAPLPVRGEDSVAIELKTLRQLLDRQAKQLETLAEQVARLTARMDAGPDTAVESPGSPGAAEPAAGTAEFSVPVARAVTPQGSPKVHIVVKGESLEKIAKLHGTTIGDLQKVNRISDPKKLQIGQQLTLPPTTPKKEGQ